MGLLPTLLAQGLTKSELQPAVHVDAYLQVDVCPVSRDNRVGAVSREAGVAAIEQHESNNEQSAEWQQC